MADAEAKFRDELNLVLGSRGTISNARINAILNIAFDSIHVTDPSRSFISSILFLRHLNHLTL